MSDSADASDSDPETRLTVVCSDGTTIGCANFEAIDSGVLSTEDLEKDRVMGFVPHDEVRFVLPSGAAERAVDRTDDEFEDPLMGVPGVGETYAKRPRAAGYTSVGDLAAADPAALAEETGATEARTREWVERASGTGGSDEE